MADRFLSGAVVSGTTEMAGAIAHSGVLAISLSADQNDYAPTGIATAASLRIATGTPRTITGLDASSNTEGRRITIVNNGTTYFTLADQSASSTAANRFAFAAGDLVLPPGQSIELEYVTADSRWRAVSGLPVAQAQIDKWKEPVEALSINNVTLSGSTTIDGVATGTGLRVLLTNQTSAVNNGIYITNASGAWSRATDFDAESEILGAVVFVKQGTVNAGTVWYCTNTATPLLGVSSIAFARFPIKPHDHTAAAGDGGKLTNDVHDTFIELEPQIVDSAAPTTTGALRLFNRDFLSSGVRRYVPQTRDDLGTTHDLWGDIDTLVRNVSGSTIAANQVVYLSGNETGTTVGPFQINLADGDDPTKLPAIGVTLSSSTNGGYPTIRRLGYLRGLDTSAFTAGDLLYPSTTAGAWTNVQPGPFVRPFARVIRSHASAGVIYIAPPHLLGTVVQPEVDAENSGIYNGGFTLWPYGTSFSVPTSTSVQFASRWIYNSTSAGVVTIDQDTTLPTVAATVQKDNQAARLTVTTADASVASADNAIIEQILEGYRWVPFAQRQFTLSFWVKATLVGTYCIAFRNGSDRSYIAEYTVNTTETWELKTITVPASPSGGTWNYKEGNGLVIDFILMGGSLYQSTANSWLSANAFCTSNQVNFMGTVNNKFRLWGVTMSLGPTAKPYRSLSYVQEYYESLNGQLDTDTRNPVWNAGFLMWTNGTSFPAASGETANKWSFVVTAPAIATVDQETSLPTVTETVQKDNTALRVNVTTIDASITSGDVAVLFQTIEGYRWRPFAQRTITIGFWVNATKTGTYCFSLRNNGADRSYVAEYTVNASDTWEYKTITIPPSPSAGSWDYTTGIVYFSFVMMAGSSWQTTPGAWQTGNFAATANQVNAFDSTANKFRIWGIRIDVGPTVRPYRSMSWDEEYEDIGKPAIHVPYNAGDFTADGVGVWTVDSGDIVEFWYILDGKMMTVCWYILQTSVSGSPLTLRIKIPASKTAARAAASMSMFFDPVASQQSLLTYIAAGGTVINLAGRAFGNIAFDTVTNNSYAAGQITFPIQ